MKNNDFINEPDDKEIDMMLKYVPTYSADNALNIKNKFMQKAKMKQKKFSFKKIVLVAAAASMVLITTLVYAEVIDISKIYSIIFGENSDYVEKYIEPIVSSKDIASANENIQSEYDGIVIKLISAIKDENDLKIFATVTDTKGDRLNESLEIAKWGLSQGYGGNASVVDYNSETKTATLMITSLGNDHQGSATLFINDFSTGQENLENLPENNINISELLKWHTPKLISQEEVWKQGGGGDRKLYEKSQLLKIDETDIKFDNTDMFSISNIGFADGVLHIQARVKMDDAALAGDYYINAKFVNSEKEIVYDPTARIDFIADKKYAYENSSKEPHYKYIEMIYDNITNPEQLNGLSVTIDYDKLPKVIKGNWEFSFMVPEKITTELHVDKEININGDKLKIDMISLSPLGITVHLPKDMSADYKHSDAAYIEYKDGTTVELNKPSIHTYEGTSTVIFGGKIIEIEKVQSIIINGERIDASL